MITILNITWEELEALDREQTVVFLPVAPIEEHGRHLPLGVDIILTERWQCDTIALIEQEGGRECLTLPTMPFGYADLKGFNGNFHVSKTMLWDFIYRAVENIAGWGFKNIVVLSGHADPLHLVTIEHACTAINEKYGTVAFAPMGAILGGNEDNDNLKKVSPDVKTRMREFPNDFHAGWIETSSILDIDLSLVKESYRQMPDVQIAPQDMMNGELIAKQTKNYGHLGAPRLADRAIGALLNQDMAQTLHAIITRFLKRDGFEPYAHHFLYPILSRIIEEERACIPSDNFH